MLRMIILLGCSVVLIISLAVPSALAFNKMLYSDGDGDYVEIVDSPILNGLDTQITIEAWINPDWYPNDWMSIVYKADECCEVDNVHRSFSLWLHHNGFIHFTSTFISSEPFLLLLNSPSGSIQLGTWYHIAGVIDTVNHNMTLLINGHEVASGSSGDSIRTSTLPLKIGSSQEPHPNFSEFAGYLDEVRIWNIARTQEEIQDAMNRPLTLDEIQSENLVGYWNFDDETADDLSQYGNHGTLKGGARIVNTIYVSEEGSDTTGDGSADNPYRTIQKGIDESGRKDIVQVLPGVYEENIELVSDLIVLGSGAEETTITSASGNIVTANNVHNVTLSEFTIDGQGTADNGILCIGTISEMEISNNIVMSSTAGIECLDAANVEIKNNTIKQNARDGIECSGSTDVTINDNNINDNERHGIACNGNATVRITNNDIRRNYWYGVSSWSATDVTIHYNVISENKSEGTVCTDSSTVTFISNTIQYNFHGIWCAGNAVVNIADNLIHSNKHRGIVLAGSSNTTIIRNIIRNHHGAIDCHDSVTTIIGGNLTDANNLADNRGIGIHNWASTTINATYNYWGTIDEDEIAAMMRNEGEGSIVFKPFINTLDEIIADTSGDGTVSAYDAALILQYVVGLIDKFPATNPIGQAAQKYISGEITIAELDRMLQSFGYPSVFKLLGYENQLLQNYPNPFNPETWIPFKLAQNAPVSISIYDTKGQLIRTIALGQQNAGIYTTKDKAVYWDGRSNTGEKVSSGVYYYTLQAGDFTATRKMVIMK